MDTQEFPQTTKPPQIGWLMNHLAWHREWDDLIERAKGNWEDVRPQEKQRTWFGRLLGRVALWRRDTPVSVTPPVMRPEAARGGVVRGAGVTEDVVSPTWQVSGYAPLVPAKGQLRAAALFSQRSTGEQRPSVMEPVYTELGGSTGIPDVPGPYFTEAEVRTAAARVDGSV